MVMAMLTRNQCPCRRPCQFFPTEAFPRVAKRVTLEHGIRMHANVEQPVAKSGNEYQSMTISSHAHDSGLEIEREIGREANVQPGHVTDESERALLTVPLGADRAELLGEVFRVAPSFLAVYHGPQHVYAMVNDAYYQLIGHGREIIGKPLLEALPEVRGQGFDVLLDGVLRTGEPFVAREIPVRLERTPGAPLEDRVVALTYLPLTDADGTRTGVIAHGTDVTEYVMARLEVERLLAESNETRRAELELANRQLQEQAKALQERSEAAEKANRAKSEFLAVMSHELRTPLNAIGGYTELIELGVHGPVTEAQRIALARIQSSQRHLLGLISGVLDYSRVEAGAVVYRFADVPVAEAIAEAETLVAPQLRQRGLGFTWAGCTPTLAVRADREKLQQILLNLLGNAVKFTFARDGVAGRIEVECSVATRPRGENVAEHVQIHVRDTGEGIAPEELERVFAPFVQVDQRFTRLHAGVGLGLAISRDLARGMGGDLTLESELGVGSTFTLTLPAAEGSDAVAS